LTIMDYFPECIPLISADNKRNMSEAKKAVRWTIEERLGAQVTARIEATIIFCNVYLAAAAAGATACRPF
jgi:hypothetical protein